MERSRNPKCLCGCNRPVRNLWNKYLPGHNARHLSPESDKRKREKISIFMKEFYKNPEVIEKKKLVWKNRHHTKESRDLMSIRAKEREAKKKERGWVYPLSGRLKISKTSTGHHMSEEAKQKSRETKKKNGYKPSEEQRQQISKTLQEYYKTHPNPFKDKHHSLESIEKNRKSHLGIWRGELASNWQGGISSFPYGIEWTPWLAEEIRIRDNHICQNPRCTNPHKILDVHHIDYNKENNNPTNLITLCKRCHGKTQRKRWYWKLYYQIIIITKT
jgi:hypothetical protein